MSQLNVIVNTMLLRAGANSFAISTTTSFYGAHSSVISLL